MMRRGLAGSRRLGEGGQPVNAGGGGEPQGGHRPGQEASSIKVDHESPPGSAWCELPECDGHDDEARPPQIYIGPVPVLDASFKTPPDTRAVP